jgi:protocatechuate 3,4-dioxygenase beta subunit
VYSAYATGTICNPGTMTTEQKMFCRGVQMTNEAGRVDFNTIFPGWYRGRALHVHFTVRVNGQETKTSQLYFDDKLIDEIHAQGVYKARGKRDTVNSADGFFMSGNATAEQVVLGTTKLNTGVLHAWKMLSVMS